MRIKALALYALLAFCAGCVMTPEEGAKIRTIVLQSPGFGEAKLQIDMPKRYDLSRKDGPDFAVLALRDDSTNDVMGIYEGHYPNLFSRQEDVKNPKKESSQVGNTPVEWIEWESGGYYRSETLVSGFIPNSSVVLHLFISANTLQEAALLRQAAETLRLSSK
jgi:hypothetical protein